MNEHEPLRLLQKHLLRSPFIPRGDGAAPAQSTDASAWIDPALSLLLVAARLFCESPKLLLPAQRALSLMAPKNNFTGAYEQLQAGLRTIAPSKGEGFLRLFESAIESDTDAAEQPLGQGPFTQLSLRVQTMSDTLSLLDDVALALDRPSQKVAAVIVLKALSALGEVSLAAMQEWSHGRGLDPSLMTLLLLEDDARHCGVGEALISDAENSGLASEFALLGLLTLPAFPNAALFRAGFNPRRVAVLMSLLTPRP